jgi:hypothetical protein
MMVSSKRLPASSRLTAGVLATATYFQNMSLFGILAVLAAIFAVLLGRTTAGGVRTFAFSLLSHKTTLLSS